MSISPTRKSPGSRSPGASARRRLVPLDPFFDDPRHHLELYHGDCLQILAAMPPDCVDLIFADPPYFLSNGGITCHAGRMVSVNKGAWDRSQGPAQNHEFNRAWLQAAQRVLKPNGSIWVSGTAHVIHSVGFAMQQLGFKLLNDISWVKPNPPPNLSCRYFTHATETIIWAAKNSKSRHTFNYKLMKDANAGKQMKSVWTIPPPETWEKKFGKHPTQKPLALLDRILRASSNEGDLVLDPFMGSGTTLVAALRLRRFTIGVEFDASFAGLALSRVVAELVVVQIGTVIVPCGRNARTEIIPKNDQIDLDPHTHSVDRSVSGERRTPVRQNATNPSMSEAITNRLVHKERNFFFVGSDKREVVFSTAAQSMEEAWQRFHSSSRSTTAIMFVIKTETEIYLA
ncbi:MAG TPA: site-specific DNA-methyltransferase [Candidatus Acidoferrales bacterium]|nr:site-specific DNA-methyltransferase [Candidatus Acidoferrales bacterium]